MIRLYVEGDLFSGNRLLLSQSQHHYLIHVMRRHTGDGIAVFNGQQGLWEAVLDHDGSLHVKNILEEQSVPLPALRLFFSPIKRLSDLIEKATELGVTHLSPILCDRTVVRGWNEKRVRAIAIEASEQSGRLTLPQLFAPRSFQDAFKDVPGPILFCDPVEKSIPLRELLSSLPPSEVTLVVGPEGGWTPRERDFLLKREGVFPIRLGSLCLRSETAAMAALAILTAWRSSAG